jgi:chromosomal replication initiation ATPase DnaA
MSDAVPAPRGRGQLALDLGHETSFGEADFTVGDGNRLAYGHVLAWPDWPGPLTLLLGPAKSGKSHLARIWASRSGARYATPRTAERLAGQGEALPLVVEDADRSGYGEAALFHLLNQSIRNGRPLLLTAREPIANWPFATDDLKSRARLASQFAVELSDDIELSQMLVKLFGDRQVTVDPRIIGYLVARMERSAEEAVVLTGMLDRMALERGTAVTRAIATEALALRHAARDDGQLSLDFGDDDE